MEFEEPYWDYEKEEPDGYDGNFYEDDGWTYIDGKYVRREEDGDEFDRSYEDEDDAGIDWFYGDETEENIRIYNPDEV